MEKRKTWGSCSGQKRHLSLAGQSCPAQQPPNSQLMLREGWQAEQGGELLGLRSQLMSAESRLHLPGKRLHLHTNGSEPPPHPHQQCSHQASLFKQELRLVNKLTKHPQLPRKKGVLFFVGFFFWSPFSSSPYCPTYILHLANSSVCKSNALLT